MATRRMFSKIIIDADEFIEMPATARLLYYDLGMRADDDGFVQPQKVMKITGSSGDDLKVLIAKRLIISFDNERVLVVADWKIHNNIRVDRYTETIYKEYKKILFLNENNQYCIAQNQDVVPDVIPSACTGKVRIGKVREEAENLKISGDKSEKTPKERMIEGIKKNKELFTKNHSM